MAQPEGPWGRKASPGLTGGQRRLIIWLAVLLAGALGIWKLSEAFPDAVQSDWDRVRLINLASILALTASGVILGRRFRTRETARNIALWCAVFAGLGLGYTFRGELGALGDRVRGELLPATPVTTASQEMAIQASEDGSYYVDGTVNGATAHFAIDTGASSIVLSPDDAARAGFDIAHLNYSIPIGTAHGIGFSAAAHVDRLVIGRIELHDVEVDINKSPMDSSLLGMTFLRRLNSFGVENGRFVMRWR